MKKENTTLLRKLTSYSAMAGSVIAVAGTANAQALYTDIDPDVTVDQSGSVYMIDLDNNGSNDFTIGLLHSTSAGGNSLNKIFAKPYNGSIGGTHQGAYNYPYAMVAGEMIDANIPWQNAASQTMGSGAVLPGYSSLYIVYGKWYGVEDRYLPLRFKIGTNKFYGWARLDVSSIVNSFTIKDIAYNPNANEGLFAGQGDPTLVHVTPTTQPVKIFAYDGVVNAMLFSQKIDNATLVMTNMMGEQVKKMKLTESSTQIDVSDLAFGIYGVTVINGGELYTQKIAIRK
ncbi:MAG: T9SS type A sorting domain-containing protein [Chitinophagales bacterium]